MYPGGKLCSDLKASAVTISSKWIPWQGHGARASFHASVHNEINNSEHIIFQNSYCSHFAQNTCSSSEHVNQMTGHQNWESMPVGKPDRESWTYLSKACLSSMCTGSHSQHCKAKQANKNKGTQTEFLSPSLFVCKRMMQEIERKGEGFYLTPKCTLQRLTFLPLGPTS